MDVPRTDPVGKSDNLHISQICSTHFGGIASMLERTLGQCLESGLPESFLEIALLWTLAGRIQRRSAEISCKRSETELPNMVFVWMGGASDLLVENPVW